MKKVITGTVAVVCAACAAFAQNPRRIAFTGDHDCGISSAKTYTHAVSLGSCETWGDFTVNGQPFYRVTTVPNPEDQIFTVPGGFTFTGIPPFVHPGADNGNSPDFGNQYFILIPPSAEVYKILFDFHYNYPTNTLELGGLEPGQRYEFRLYQRCWQADYDRSTKLTFQPDDPNPGVLVFNPDEERAEQYIAYTYTAGSDGLFKMRYECDNPDGATVHMYAFSNEWIENPDETVSISGSPENYGTADPPYGMISKLKFNEEFDASVSPAWTNAAGTLVATVTGWETFVTNGVGGWTSTGFGAANAFRYKHPGVESRIVWSFAVDHILTATFDAAGAREGFTPFTVDFTAQLVNEDDEETVEYVWDFGDGSPWVTNTGVATVQHTYSTHGWFAVSLAVDDGLQTAGLARPNYIRAYAAATGRELVWDNNAADNLWDTASPHWNNGADVFTHGDSVAFDHPTDSLSIHLCQDSDVNTMQVYAPAGEVWTLDGASSVRVTGGNGIRFRGPGEMRFNTPFDANNIHLIGGTTRLSGGHDFVIREAAGFNDGNTEFIITNATLTLLTSDNFSMGRGAFPGGNNTVVRVQKGGVLNAGSIRLGETSAHNLLQIDGGTVNQIGETAMAGGEGGNSNRLEVVNGGVYKSTGGITLANREYHGILVDNATLTLDNGDFGSSPDTILMGSGNDAGGYHHVAAFTNSTVSVGKIYVGHLHMWSSLIVNNTTLTCHDSGACDGLNVGNDTSSNNRVDIVNNSVVVIPRNGVHVGGNGYNNVLNIENSTLTCGSWGFNLARGSGGNNVIIIGPGAQVTTHLVTLCQNMNAGGNELRLAGGSVTSTDRFEWYANSVLGVEIQPDGLPGHLRVNSEININSGAHSLRPRAAKGARPGTYLVIECTGNATIPAFDFDPPEDQKDRWSFEGVGTKELRVTYKAPYTLFMIR